MVAVGFTVFMVSLPDDLLTHVFSYLCYPGQLCAVVAFRLAHDRPCAKRMRGQAHRAAATVSKFVTAVYARAPWRRDTAVEDSMYNYFAYRRFLLSAVGASYMRRRLLRYVLQRYDATDPGSRLRAFARKYRSADPSVQRARDALLRGGGTPSRQDRPTSLRYDMARFVLTMSANEVFDAGI